MAVCSQDEKRHPGSLRLPTANEVKVAAAAEGASQSSWSSKSHFRSFGLHKFHLRTSTKSCLNRVPARCLVSSVRSGSSKRVRQMASKGSWRTGNMFVALPCPQAHTHTHPHTHTRTASSITRRLHGARATHSPAQLRSAKDGHGIYRHLPAFNRTTKAQCWLNPVSQSQVRCLFFPSSTHCVASLSAAFPAFSVALVAVFLIVPGPRADKTSHRSRT